MQQVSDPIVPEFVERLQRIDTYAEIEEIMKSPDFVMAGAEERTVFSRHLSWPKGSGTAT
jgi:hypothetical protein